MPGSLKKWTLAQVFSCEFFEMFIKHISYRTPPVTASLSPSPGKKRFYWIEDLLKAVAVFFNSRWSLVQILAAVLFRFVFILFWYFVDVVVPYFKTNCYPIAALLINVFLLISHDRSRLKKSHLKLKSSIFLPFCFLRIRWCTFETRMVFIPLQKFFFCFWNIQVWEV